jgi:uncharacterized repeat protein (TIGR01451 family)
VLFAVPYARAQVAVDAATSDDAEETGNATRMLTFAHTTTATGTNLLMLVGVSINITNVTTTAVTTVTYDGAALTFLGAHNDAGNTRRVEMWYKLAPATGNHNVAVSVKIPAAATVGVTAGAITFTGVDQTVPLAAAAYSQLNVPSVVNGMILDTLAIGGPETITVPGPQVSEWNLSTANGLGQHNDPPDVTGSGSTRTGAPSVPLSETFSANSNWSEGAVSINPTAADIGVTTTVGSAVFLGSNTTYTINVFNNGTSAANAVKLTDELRLGDPKHRYLRHDREPDRLHHRQHGQRSKRHCNRGRNRHCRRFLCEYRRRLRYCSPARSQHRQQYLRSGRNRSIGGLRWGLAGCAWNKSHRNPEHLLSRHSQRDCRRNLYLRGHRRRRRKRNRRRQSSAHHPDAGCQHQRLQQRRLRQRLHRPRLHHFE